MEKKKFIVSIGLKGFPFGTASVQKLKMMGRAIVDTGNNFMVISNEYVKKTKLNESLTKEGLIYGIKYISTSPGIFAPSSYFMKAIYKLVGRYNEFICIIKLHRKSELDAVIVYSYSFLYAMFWGVFLRMLGCPTYLVYFELRSTVSHRKKWCLKLNDKLLDRFIFLFHTGFITISGVLIKHIRKFAPNKPCLNVLPIVDFKEYNLPRIKPRRPYFLFCGSLAYIEVVEFIIKSFKKVQDKNTMLYLVLGGNQKTKERLIQLINNIYLKEKVVLISNISDNELKQLYINASALLIPLRNSMQDIARFPHKIAEYCASGRPIVSTRIGEVANFFDDTSALLADDYDIELYAKKLQFVIDNPEKCESLAQKSYQLGIEKFDYRSYSQPMFNLMFNYG